MQDTTDYFDSIAQHENDAALDEIRKSGKTQIITLTPEEKNAWKKALLVTHREMEGRVGKELIQSIYKVTGFDPGKL
jgi:C4-dicarboxylate-binding protein DctP